MILAIIVIEHDYFQLFVITISGVSQRCLCMVFKQDVLKSITINIKQNSNWARANFMLYQRGLTLRENTAG